MGEIIRKWLIKLLEPKVSKDIYLRAVQESDYRQKQLEDAQKMVELLSERIEDLQAQLAKAQQEKTVASRPSHPADAPTLQAVMVGNRWRQLKAHKELEHRKRYWEGRGGTEVKPEGRSSIS